MSAKYLILFMWLGLGSSAPQPLNLTTESAAPIITFWYGDHQRFGKLGRPQRWVNVLGHISNSAQVDSVGFSLDGGSFRRLEMGSDRHRLAKPGDFNIELSWTELPVGMHTVTVHVYYDGNYLERSTQLEIMESEGWPLPYWLDFSQEDRIQDVVQVVDGHWELTDDGIRTTEPYYDRVLSIGDTTWKHYEATIALTVHDFTPSSPGPPTYNVTHFGVALRWRGHHRDGRQPSRKWFPLGAQGEFLLKDDLDSCQWRILYDGRQHKPATYSQKRNSLSLNQRAWIKAQVSTTDDGHTQYRFKQWRANTPEPIEWDVAGIESDDYASGALCLVPHNSEVTIHEVRVEPLVPQDWGYQAKPGPGAIHYSAPIGGMFGARGERFETEFLHPSDKLLAIRVNLSDEGHWVKGIQFFKQGPDGIESKFLIGSAEGNWQQSFDVPSGKRWIGISGSSGWYLDSIQFHFEGGAHSPRYGGTGGDTEFNVSLKHQDARIRGLYGASDPDGIEFLGLIFDPGH